VIIRIEYFHRANIILGDWDYVTDAGSGKTSGYVQQVVNGEADMTVMISSLVPVRAQNQSFIQPTYASA